MLVPRKQRGISTFPQNETLPVAYLDTLENGTFEWIPDPRALVREVLIWENWCICIRETHRRDSQFRVNISARCLPSSSELPGLFELAGNVKAPVPFSPTRLLRDLPWKPTTSPGVAPDHLASFLEPTLLLLTLATKKKTCVCVKRCFSWSFGCEIVILLIFCDLDATPSPRGSKFEKNKNVTCCEGPLCLHPSQRQHRAQHFSLKDENWDVHASSHCPWRFVLGWYASGFRSRDD